VKSVVINELVSYEMSGARSALYIKFTSTALAAAANVAINDGVPGEYKNKRKRRGYVTAATNCESE
jgi:hypothetical protein